MLGDDLVEREQLGAPLATVELNDCHVTFRRQRGTNDVWSVATGPLGTFGHRLIENKVLQQVQLMRPARDASRDDASRRRVREWRQVRIDDDLVIALRARGNEVSYAYLFGDGAGFGGGGSRLPSSRRANPLERARSWLSGRRGSAVRRFRDQ